MGALDLAGRMTLNSSQWDQAVNAADARMSKFANNLEHKFSKKIGKYFGAGMITGALFAPLHEITSALFEGPVDRAKKLNEESKAVGMTVEQYQMAEAAARAAGVPLADWIQRIREHKMSMAEANAEMQKYRGSIKLTTADVQRLTDDSLTGQLKEKAEELNVGLGRRAMVDEATKILMQQRGQGFWYRLTHPGAVIAARNEVLATMDKDNARNTGYWSALPGLKADAGRAASLGVNEWQKVGEFVGGGSDVIVDKLSQIVEHTRETANGMKRFARRSNYSNSGIIMTDEGPAWK